MSFASPDKFQKVANGTATRLAGSGFTPATYPATITVDSTAKWPVDTDVTFAIDKITLNGTEEVQTAGTYTLWQGKVASATTITVYGLAPESPNSAQNYAPGSLTRVYIPISAALQNRIVEGITAHANQDGTLKTTAVQNALNLGTQDLNGWNPLGYTATFLQNNGNKETVVNYAGDVTNILSPGMKVAYTRSVAPPTQCMAFQASSSQYATKASPTGLSFTTTFSVEALVYMTSYSSGTILGRFDGTNGFTLVVSNTGQLYLYAQSSTYQNTHLTVPLNKFVHLAATYSAGSIVIYLNGAVAASVKTGSGTSITQGGPLQIGAGNTGNYFNGFVSEARIWSTVRTQAEILANMNNNLTGSESGLVGLWRGAGNFNDLTANANHLTATNGAIATRNANPFNLIEYGIITKVGTFSGGLTPVTVSTGDMCNIPNMALSSPLYSTADNPFGLPGDLRSVGRRLVFIPVLAQQSTTANTAVQFNPVTNVSFTVPMNCSAIKLCLFNTSINAGTGNTLVFKFYNGSVASGTELMQINNTTANGYMSACELVPVVPGETINLNCGWSATAGTSVWSGGAARQTPAIWVETA